MGVLDHFAFVLFKPKSAGNVGSAARALKNMGFRDLRLVAPRRWNPSAATRMAVHADDIVAAAQIHPDLASAIGDRTLVVGTTARTGPYRGESRALRDTVPSLIAEGVGNRIAIVFGPEDFGLTSEELKLCQRLVTIPTAPEYPALNLAQAVMIVAYELMLAAGGARKLAGATEYAPAPAVEAMLERMAQALVTVGFLPMDNPDHIMFSLRAIFGRSGLKPRELDILSGIASQVLWFAEGGYETAAAKRRAGKKMR
jgi:tRNA/rRNA methyltransferase